MSYREELFKAAKQGKERMKKEHEEAVSRLIKNDCEHNAFYGRFSVLIRIGAKLEDKTILTEEEIIEFAKANDLDYEVYPSQNSVKLGFDIPPNMTTQEE